MLAETKSEAEVEVRWSEGRTENKETVFVRVRKSKKWTLKADRALTWCMSYNIITPRLK